MKISYKKYLLVTLVMWMALNIAVKADDKDSLQSNVTSETKTFSYNNKLGSTLR